MRGGQAGALQKIATRTFMLMALLLAASQAQANFGAFEKDVPLAEVFPGADSFGPEEGSPPATPAFKDGKIVGYVFVTSDIGYSGKPIRLRAAMDVNGTIVGAKVIEHHEPILLAGIPEQKLFDFAAAYVGKSVIEVTAPGAKRPAVEIVSGATVSVIVIDDGVLRTALKIARSRGLAGFAPGASGPRDVIRDVPFVAKNWQTLIGDGSVRRLSLTHGEVDKAFKAIGIGPEAHGAAHKPDDTFINLHIALVSPEIIGRNVLGSAEYDAMQAWLAPKQPAIIIAAEGSYSFRGSGYVRGGIFDRIQVIQEGISIRLNDKVYRRMGAIEAEGAPNFPEIGLFKIPPSAEFDPAKPWRLEMLAQRDTGAKDRSYTAFALDYILPPDLIEQAAAEIEPEGAALWQGIWRNRLVDVAILSLSLIILTLIFFFQDLLVKRPRLFVRLRMSFLAFTTLWIGVYAGAQLSVVNVFTFSHALVTGFRWDFFLLEPLIFILWCATAISLLFWGRGAYCGWLCPFGAVQELISAGAKRLGVKQVTLKFAWHERLWAFKYVIFVALMGVSLYSLASAERLAEIEPFKTVWLLRFAREWYWVLFAVGTLAAGIFIERFYCRYLCPLGAALAIPGRMRLFEWLKRRRQCGFECQKCAKECMVQSIHPDGQINPNECLYCLHCQVVYHDHDSCTPLLLKKLGRKKASEALQSGA
ncbi:Regulatory protein NosR [Rhodospirillaceae bacterium LM-1]|nr:Regulatory protein NosR [Rhodospirillaceae bacterium LM-1]